MRKNSRSANENAGLWLRRISAAQSVWTKGKEDRDQYVEAAALRFPALVPGAGADTMGLDVPHVDQIDVNLSRRLIDWYQSQATDEQPIITYPRDAEGDEDLAEMNEKLLGRVFQESHGVSEFRDSIVSICTQGCAAIWVGIHANVVDGKTLRDVSLPAEDASAAAMEGVHDPQAGQDHSSLAAGLRGLVDDPVLGNAMDPEQFMDILSDAQTHDRLAADEREGPHDLRLQHGDVWCRRLPVGTWTVWDHSVWDIRDARWMARKIVLTQAEMDNIDIFDAKAVRKLKTMPLTQEEGYEPLSRSSITGDISGQGEEVGVASEDDRYVIWEVWDKRWRARHYVSEGCEYFLEKDEQYPYLDDRGDPALPGFFPCRIIAPILTDEQRPYRTFGLPLLALAWPQQEEIIKLRSFALAQAKRHALRIYEVDENLDEETMASVSAGIDGTMIRRDPSADPGKTIIPVQFHSSSLDIQRMIDQVYNEWTIASGMPASDLTAQPQADTATQEMQAIQAGRQQAGDVIRQLEIAAADVIEMMRGLIYVFYRPEQIAALLGMKYYQKFDAWSRSSLKGDRLQLKFAARAKAESAVRIKQMMEAYSLLKQDVDPMTMQPRWRTDHILAEIVRGLGVGDLLPWQPTMEQQQAMMAQQAAQLSQEQGAPGEENGAGTGLPQEQDVNGQPRNVEAPSTGNLLASAARSAPGGGGPSEGFAP